MNAQVYIILFRRMLTTVKSEWQTKFSILFLFTSTSTMVRDGCQEDARPRLGMNEGDQIPQLNMYVVGGTFIDILSEPTQKHRTPPHSIEMDINGGRMGKLGGRRKLFAIIALQEYTRNGVAI